MKNEFITAISQLAAEKNLSKEVVFEAVEAALASAYKKDALATSNVVVKIDAETGTTRVFTRISVVEEIEDPETEVSAEDGRKLKAGVQVGDVIDTEVQAQDAGRIAAQTAKQVVLQRLRDAEREVVYAEYSGREGATSSSTSGRRKRCSHLRSRCESSTIALPSASNSMCWKSTRLPRDRRSSSPVRTRT